MSTIRALTDSIIKVECDKVDSFKEQYENIIQAYEMPFYWHNLLVSAYKVGHLQAIYYRTYQDSGSVLIGFKVFSSAYVEFFAEKKD